MRNRILLPLACALVLAFPLPVQADDQAALANLTALRQQYPDDVDHALARAQLLARMGDDKAALRDLRDAAVLAPDYEDVWRVRYAVLTRQNTDEARRERAEVLDIAAQRFPDSHWWRQAQDEIQPERTIVAGGSYEDLDQDLPSWNRLFIDVAHERNWGRYRFGLARDTRFGKSDITLSTGGDLELPSHWSVGADVSVAFSPEFQPDLGYATHVVKSLPDGWVVTLRYQRREYPTATVGSIVPAVEKYIGNFRIAYTLGHSRLHGAASSLSHTLTGNWYYSDRASVGININAGEETEAIGAGRVLRTDVAGISVNGRQYLGERMDLQWWLGIHEQGDFYRRSFLGMAVAYRF